MQMIKRLLRCVPLLLSANAVWLCGTLGARGALLLLPAAVLSLMIHCKPCASAKQTPLRLRALNGGAELLLLFALCFLPQCGFLWYTFAPRSLLYWGNALLSSLLLFAALLNGVLRIFVCSAQVGLVWRVLLLLFWWMPGLNFYLIVQARACAVREYRVELSHLEQERAATSLCETRYPILLVHGIFFRDWQLVDYWGRIPRALRANGAKVFYGKQQSADAVERSAQELCQQIIRIIQQENCGKVNIIAHSKGGLDSRCAISRYGMDKYVASLTTVNTPHHGCNFADLLLRILPKGLIRFIAGRYNVLYRKLGDTAPDFEKGVRDLTAARCMDFNRNTPDAPGVYYQSVMSKLRSFSGAIFPMNLCYLLIRKLDGDNDGLVSVDSAIWGEQRPLIETSFRKGISHGDVVDLLRENLRGFDVRDYYIQLVHELKERGL